jgi:hypothetical protein
MNNSDMPAMPPASDFCQLWVDDRDPKKGTVEALGLTKREHFAGLAMQGWLARCANTPHSHKLEPEGMARVAVEMADALLAELNKDNS